MYKIVIIGPESTGKSTLCEELAQYYQTSWCPEFAREFLLTFGTDYTYEDLLSIAKGQLAMEDEYTIQVKSSFKSSEGISGPGQMLFIDTDMYVMKVWCEFVFGKCHQWILDNIIERRYDLYLLCNTDLPWEKDELREYPDLDTREKLFHMYRDLLLNQPVPWTEISGTDQERLQKAIAAVDRLIRSAE